MPFIKVWLHVVWSTKNRFPFLTKEIRQIVFEHIRQNATTKGIFLDCVNGYQDHIHCLVSLSSDQTISKLMQLIKGESSFWINKQNLCSEKFEWQEEYFAVSVSQSKIADVRAYIYNQEQHHEKKTFQQEYDEFIRNYEFAEQAIV
ncbi:MAG: IS200/IS605 family transposase [Chitinophagaceae bacterium]